MSEHLFNILLVLCVTSSFYNPTNGEVQTIIFIGRSGSGISSTISTLLGNARFQNASALTDPGKPLSLTEYPVFLNGSEILRIVDVPGLIDDKGEDEDDEILRNLRDYLSTRRNPLFVTVSYFYDSRYEGESSLFVQLLEKVKTGQENLRPVPRNILHLNYLLSETKAKQRKPQLKLQSFVSVAGNFSHLNFEGATVGENHGEEEGLLKNENGMTLLPNKETYPLNLLQAILNVTDDNFKGNFQAFLTARNTSTDIQERQLSFTKRNRFPKFTALNWNSSMANRSDTLNARSPNENSPKFGNQEEVKAPFENTTAIPISTTNELPHFANTNFTGQLRAETFSSASPRQNERMRMDALKQNCSTQNPPELITQTCDFLLKFPNITETADLADFFLSKNVTKIPETLLEKTMFFQDIFKFLKETYSTSRVDTINDIIRVTFRIEQMPYTGKLLPGLGYDILSSEETGSSPYLEVGMGNWEPSELGFKFPPYIVPTPLRNISLIKSHFLFQTREESVLHRLQRFNNGSLSQVSSISRNYEGPPLFGYNIIEDLEEQPSLTSGIEVRTSFLSFDKRRASLNPEFTSDVKSLSAVNTRDKNSVKEWEDFFRRYGTHVVKGTFYGGTIQGNVFAQHLSTVSKPELEEMLRNLTDFFPLAFEKSRTYYAAFGGERFQDVGILPERNGTEREEVLQRWRRTVPSQPVPLPNEMDVFPIFTAAKDVGEQYEGNVRKAWKLYVQGNLKYERKRERTSTTERTSTVTMGNGPSNLNYLGTSFPTMSTRFTLSPFRPTPIAQVLPEVLTQQIEGWKTWMNQSSERHEFFKSVATNTDINNQNITVEMKQLREQMQNLLKEREELYKRRRDDEKERQDRLEEERRLRWSQLVQQGDEEEMRREQRFQEDLKRIREDNEIKRNFTLMMIQQEVERVRQEEENGNFVSKGFTKVKNWLFG